MKILLLNQAFHPDVVSTAQHATDLALGLQEAGHEVTVVASRRGYDDSTRLFPSRETWNGLNICRIRQLRLGKSSRWRRALDFASFSANCLLRLLLLPRHDVVIAMTSPPLISALGAFIVRLKGGSFVFWVMDLNPDEAIAAGWLQASSRFSRFLAAILKYSLDRAALLVALDRFMQQRLLDKGVAPDRIAVIPPWSHDGVAYDPAARDAFRRAHNLDGKFVVMYSGNHSPCHSLDTLLDAALRLRDDARVTFCFIGGGTGFAKVESFAAAHNLPNIRCLPYQPRATLSGSLSAADLHVVAMGDPFVGIVHPCKVYNIRSLGIPFLYIGPAPSHVTELNPAASFRHGDAPGVVRFILDSVRSQPVRSPLPEADGHSQPVLLARMLENIEVCALGSAQPQTSLRPSETPDY